MCLNEHTDAVTCARYNKSGRSIITASEDCLAVVYILDSCNTKVKMSHQLTGHTESVNFACFSPDDK